MLKEQLEKYTPFNEQEENDKKIMLRFLDDFDNCLTRDNEYGHFTSSAWIVNKEHTKVLMIYHNIYKSWAWTGGHADGDEDLKAVALREANEETGLENLRILNDEIFSLEIITVNGHIKRGKYVSSHVHMNVVYLIEADENEPLRIKPDENSGVKWVDIDEVKNESTEQWLIENVYSKLNIKLKMR